VEFTELTEETKVFPGEYLLHVPSKAVVLVGAYNWSANFVRVLKHGRLLEDTVAHFKKIRLTAEEHRTHRGTKCGSCKGGG